jgi:hypothetical protein
MKMYANIVTESGKVGEQHEIEITDEQYFRMLEENKNSEINKMLKELGLNIFYVDLKPKTPPI